MSVRLVRVLAAIAGAVLALGVQAAEMVSVSVSEATLRSGPGQQHEAMWNVVQGYPLQVIARQGRWLKVKDFESDQSWINRAAVGTAPYVIVKVRGARLRDKPATNGRALGMVQYGEVLAREESSKGWVRVRTANRSSAWIQSRLVWGL